MEGLARRSYFTKAGFIDFDAEEKRHLQTIVIPAKAGIHSPVRWGKEPQLQRQWIPAFAGMTRILRQLGESNSDGKDRGADDC